MSSTVLSVVVISYRTPQLLAECLRAIALAVDRVDGMTEVIVVDNASGDESADVARAAASGTLVVELGRNAGFAGGIEAALDHASGEWIALVNSDATVEPGTFVEMLRAGADPSIGSVAAQMRFADRPNTINSAGIEVDRLGVAGDRLLGAPAAASETEPTEVFGASGGAALYRKAMLDEVGGFDESFFLYLEDVDLAWRARMAGWRAVYAPRAVVFHHYSASAGHGSPLKHYLVGRNRWRVLAKNATTRQLATRLPAMLAYDLAYVVFTLVRQRTLAPVRGRIRGMLEWPAYRSAGRDTRRALDLPPAFGVRRALARRSAYIGRSNAPHGSLPVRSRS